MSNVAGKASVDENLRRGKADSWTIYTVKPRVLFHVLFLCFSIELYFLIIKFLSEGPCTSAAEVGL